MISIRFPVALGVLAASFLAQAQVFVSPRASSLRSGQTCDFRVHSTERPFSGLTLPAPGLAESGLAREDWVWTVLDGGAGAIDAATGVYRAPPLDTPCIVKIGATCRSRPDLRAEATVLVGLTAVA